MLLPGKTYNPSSYTHGFNGQMKDEEWTSDGNSIDYIQRGYDPRIVRFRSMDPKFKDYPWYSPYQFAGNTPIVAIDLDGLEPGAHPFSYMMRNYPIFTGLTAGVTASISNSYKFIVHGAWQANTWKQTGLALEEAMLSSSPYSGIYNPNTPRIDAAVASLENNVINGTAYSRSKFLGEFATDVTLGILADKGISKISSLRVFTNTGQTLQSTSIRFTQNSVNNFGDALRTV